MNVLGFLDAVTYQVIPVMDKKEKYLNADSVCRGLRILREQNPKEEQIYVVLDNAAYQRCKKVKEAAKEYRIILVFLPPYLIERFWKFLRNTLLSVCYYTSFDCFFDAVETFICTAHIHYKEKLASLLSFRFQILDASFCLD